MVGIYARVMSYELEISPTARPGVDAIFTRYGSRDERHTHAVLIMDSSPHACPICLNVVHDQHLEMRAIPINPGTVERDAPRPEIRFEGGDV